MKKTEESVNKPRIKRKVGRSVGNSNFNRKDGKKRIALLHRGEVGGEKRSIGERAQRKFRSREVSKFSKGGGGSEVRSNKESGSGGFSTRGAREAKAQVQKKKETHYIRDERMGHDQGR